VLWGSPAEPGSVMPPPSLPPDSDPAPSGIRSGRVPSRPSHEPAEPLARTLPPPDWTREAPRSAASVALERYQLDRAVERRNGPRAELVALFAKLESSGGDELAERVAAAALARALSTRGTQLDVATRLARRALLIGDDAGLREDLAGWFVSLGEPALSAATLRPLVPAHGGSDAAALLVRIGVLLARAGEARAASDAFADAADADPTDPVPVETRASLSAWAPAAVTPEQAAEAYLAAAERREARGDRAAAFEDWMRAFEIAPAYAPAADQLAKALLARGRSGAADEVRREHAAARGDEAHGLHLRRMRQAVKDGDLARALGAAFDARLDAEIDLRSVLAAIDPIEGADEAPLGIDGLLERANLHELLAARLEVASDALSGPERARARVALGRLYSGPLGRPDRAVDAWIDALVADPGCEPAHEALRRHAVITRDHSPWIEALIRIASDTAEVTRPARAACVRELVALAEERLGDPLLSLWATNRLGSAPDSEALRESGLRLEPRARLAEESLERARADLAKARGPERLALLTRLAGMLSGCPDLADRYIEVLLELIEQVPEERAHAIAAERVLTRLGRADELEALFERQAARAASGVERARIRLAIATLKRRRGDVAGALAVLVPLLGEPGSHAAAWNVTLLLAAQQNDQRSRALSIGRIAGQLPPSLRAVLTAVAAEELLAAGDVEAARAASEQACHADPSLARPAAARARVGVIVGGRFGAEAIERALSIVVPRPALCAALARIYDALDEPLLATTWAQRSGTLRPGDLDTARGRLSRALAGSDGARLADTLAWFLSQPQRLASAADLIAQAVEKLSELAPGRAGALARRALDVLGPRDPALRSAVLAAADRVGERGLAIAVIERWLATGSLGSERAHVLLDLCRRRKLAGDADGAARALCRALDEGALATTVLVELDSALPTRSSDGEIALLQARAEALSALPEADRRGTAHAWRELGAALFDLAGDRHGAFRAWDRALALDSERGAENLASDLIAFAGERVALERLSDHALRRGDSSEAAHFHALAASIALGAGETADAFLHARRTLEIDPSRSETIAIAERAAGDGELDDLEKLYDGLAESSLGCFGERAVRYRAARQFERRGLPARAMRHAVGAFEAVPSEGVVFVTLARLADKCGRHGDLVRSLERVALENGHAEQRSRWLRRAAAFAGQSEEGQRQRVDVLLRALAVRADTELVASLGQAMTELLELQPDERDAAELRFVRAANSVLERVEGPEGARIAIELAITALSSFAARSLALRAVRRAVECDGDMDEFGRLLTLASDLAQAEETKGFVASLLELSAQKFVSAGATLLELGAALAAASGDRASAARLLVLAASRAPDRVELVKQAEQAARELDDPALIAAVLDTMPDQHRFALLMQMLDAAEQSGDVSRSFEILERARTLTELTPEQKGLLFDRSVEFLRQTGRHDELEAALADEMERADLVLERVPKLASELAALASARGRPEGALAVLGAALERVPDHPVLLGDLAALARQAGDRERQARALARLLDLGADPPQRANWLRELAALYDALGDEAEALVRWSELHALDPDDAEALVALERRAEQAGDHETLVRLLDRRAALATRHDDVRRLRLRRAIVLEQRLGRSDEAKSELEALLASTGDHLSVLRVLADLDERLSDPLAAAPLWLRASALATERAEAADLAQRSCQAYLRGGDVEAALRVLEGMGAWVDRERMLLLGVELERRRQNPAGLADALDELASFSQASAETRARILMEAAQASLAAGAAERALDRASRARELAPALEDLREFGEELSRAADEMRNRAKPTSSAAELAERRSAPSVEVTGSSAVELTAEELAEVEELEAAEVRPSEPVSVSVTASRPSFLPDRAEAGASERPLIRTDPSYPTTPRAHIVIDADDEAPQAPSAPASVAPSGQSAAPESAPPSPAPASPLRERAENVSASFIANSDEEVELHLALADGSMEAGFRLLQQIEGAPDRTHDRVAVYRRLALLAPGDPALLEHLAAAARDDRNLVHATAVAHVLEQVRPQHGAIEPPPLEELATEGVAVRALLFRETVHPTLETLALVWETAPHLFRRDPGAYGITGLERVQPVAPTPLGRTYAGTARAIGALRTPLFQRRTAGPITVGVALLAPPAVVLSGDVQSESPELRFHLGAMLAAASSQLVMLFGLPESQARSVLRALGFAFGPSRPDASSVGLVLNLAEMLWESIPARQQRRLRELCQDQNALDYERAMVQARVAVRRAGLFACGDFGVAVREVCADEALDASLLTQPGGLAQLAANSASIRSIYALSLSAEYAETRWRGARWAQRLG
jgi:tetratricopeptide (TPR) repeat protein